MEALATTTSFQIPNIEQDPPESRKDIEKRIFAERDAQNEAIQSSDLSATQKTFYQGLNCFIAAHMVDRGEGPMSAITEVVVNFLGKRAMRGNLRMGRIDKSQDSLSAPYSYEWVRVESAVE